jgi:hypothetical protein
VHRPRTIREVLGGASAFEDEKTSGSNRSQGPVCKNH